MKTLRPIEQDFMTAHPYVTIDTVLNRTTYAPIDTFIDGKLSAFGLNSVDMIRFINVASQAAPNLYAADKANCFVSIFTTAGNDLLVQDVDYTSPFTINISYLTGVTLSTTNAATESEWVSYLSSSIAECNKIYKEQSRSFQLEQDIQKFIKSTNDTIIATYHVVPSKEPALVASSHETANTTLHSEI